MTSQFVSCPDCHVLVLDTVEERREHRAADRQDRQVIEALRRGLRAAEDAAKTAVQAVRVLQRDLEGLDGRVREAADTPEPDPVLVGEWPEDELDDPDEQGSQYADETVSPEPDHHDGEQPDDVEDEHQDSEDDTYAITQPAGRDPLRDYFTGPTTIR